MAVEDPQGLERVSSPNHDNEGNDLPTSDNLSAPPPLSPEIQQDRSLALENRGRTLAVELKSFCVDLGWDVTPQNVELASKCIETLRNGQLAMVNASNSDTQTRVLAASNMGQPDQVELQDAREEAEKEIKFWCNVAHYVAIMYYALAMLLIATRQR